MRRAKIKRVGSDDVMAYPPYPLAIRSFRQETRREEVQDRRSLPQKYYLPLPRSIYAASRIISRPRTEKSSVCLDENEMEGDTRYKYSICTSYPFLPANRDSEAGLS